MPGYFHAEKDTRHRTCRRFLRDCRKSRHPESKNRLPDTFFFCFEEAIENRSKQNRGKV